MALEHRPAAPGTHTARAALRVLEAVDTHRDGVGADQLARETGLPMSQLVQVLSMLRRDQYLGLLPGGGYVTGEAAAAGDGTRAERLGAALVELRDAVGAAVYFCRYGDGEVRVAGVADGPTTPRVNEWVDFRSAGHASAAGKCLLAQLDHRRRLDHFSRHRPARLTSHTEVDERVLLSRLDRQPATAPTLDLQEYAIGTVCAAIPVTIGQSAACIALSMPLSEVHRLRPAAETLHRQAAPVLLAVSL
ncbi:IclR family transcriptional regulator domain-containing protein [Actinacidiphila yeochonensis]|uniref:IclR family transcriptional regulator domain-containing protein n=1 Tax=Actinacidiphila yeochonensis TaxID=89050 RepID=UPI00056119AB|nr:IclR family transcriptional regulator C-terminal domain-containing protein [Actinacidiphila yeochonensis]